MRIQLENLSLVQPSLAAGEPGQVGCGAHVASPTLSVDRPTGRGVEREKRKISIGPKALVGFGAHIGGNIGNDATVKENCSVLIQAANST